MIKILILISRFKNLLLQESVNIVCLDVPYPANYGGAINMFHKIRWLHKKGIAVYLHCFQYGERGPAQELEKHCKGIYYYKRKTGLRSFLSFLPYNVKSRVSVELKKNLLKNDFPIIFEALHTCYLLSDKDFKKRNKLFRESNIEHEYFLHLAKNEKNIFKKFYFYTEAFKLKRFEKVVIHSNVMLIVSTEDEAYFKNAYPQSDVKFLPSFHQNDQLLIQTGVSNYILYHGNLSVSENYVAASWLIDHVFCGVKLPVIIAGLNPPQFLEEKISQYSHITLKKNCSREEMDSLIENAQIHCLYTPQATGLKLKLLNVLYKGRFVIANAYMLHGTALQKSCVVADTSTEYIRAIEECMTKEFSEQQIETRKNDLKIYNNEWNTDQLIKYIKH